MVNMTSVSNSSKKSQKLQSSVHQHAALDQMNAANRNAVLMDEYSDEDEDFQCADQEVLFYLGYYNVFKVYTHGWFLLFAHLQASSSAIEVEDKKIGG